METLLSIAIALCAGLLVSRFVKPLKLPAVTGYLIAGILIGRTAWASWACRASASRRRQM